METSFHAMGRPSAPLCPSCCPSPKILILTLIAIGALCCIVAGAMVCFNAEWNCLSVEKWGSGAPLMITGGIILLLEGGVLCLMRRNPPLTWEEFLKYSDNMERGEFVVFRDDSGNKKIAFYGEGDDLVMSSYGKYEETRAGGSYREVTLRDLIKREGRE